MAHRLGAGVDVVDMVSREHPRLAGAQALALVPTVHAHLAHRVELPLLRITGSTPSLLQQTYLQGQLVGLLGGVVEHALVEGALAAGRH